MGYSGYNFKMRFLLPAILLFTAPAFTVYAQTAGGGIISPGKGYSLDDDLIYRLNFGSAADVQLLLDKGANPNAKTPQGESALDVALERNDAETFGMAKALIDKGADTNDIDKSGNPPIVNAIRYKEPDIVKMLIEKGVDVHIKTPEGIPLIEYAKRYGDTDTAKSIQAIFDKEKAYQDSLRTPERFKQFVQKYATDSCLYQYWAFFESSRQEPGRDDEVKAKVEELKSSLGTIVVEVQKYYSDASTQAMLKVASRGVDGVYKDLNGMISNYNRSEHGVGKDSDAADRCQRIIGDLKFDLAPTMRPESPSPQDQSSEAEGSSTAATPPPLPIDSAPPGHAPPGHR
jgi:Ankyrin repeats (3 copies)